MECDLYDKRCKAGNPILADSDTAQNLIVIHGTGKAEKPYENVHAFGEEEAFDMNKHAYKNGTGGNYMHITRASKSAEMLLSNKAVSYTHLTLQTTVLV